MNKTNKGVIEKINTGYRKYSPNFYPNDILDDRLLGIEMKINEIINFGK